MSNDGGLGERLVAWRKARALTQQELADIVGVTQEAVARWESGVRSPSKRNRPALERALLQRRGTIAQIMEGFDPDRRVAELESAVAAIRLSLAEMEEEVQRLAERIVREYPAG